MTVGATAARAADSLMSSARTHLEEARLIVRATAANNSTWQAREFLPEALSHLHAADGLIARMPGRSQAGIQVELAVRTLRSSERRLDAALRYANGTIHPLGERVHVKNLVERMNRIDVDIRGAALALPGDPIHGADTQRLGALWQALDTAPWRAYGDAPLERGELDVVATHVAGLRDMAASTRDQMVDAHRGIPRSEIVFDNPLVHRLVSANAAAHDLDVASASLADAQRIYRRVPAGTAPGPIRSEQLAGREDHATAMMNAAQRWTELSLTAQPHDTNAIRQRQTPIASLSRQLDAS